MTTVPESLGFLAGQVAYMQGRGFEVHAVSSPGDRLQEFGASEGVRVHAVNMPRRITPLLDLVAVLQLVRLLRHLRPEIVHAHTPKGGLLGMVGAWLARVPVRIYHIHGLPFMTATGWRRRVLRWTEKVSCALADQVLCVSHSVRQVAVEDGIWRRTEIKVLLNGSINGVDASRRFDPARVGEPARRVTRKRFGIPVDAVVLGYVGRIVRDKGIVELAAAWRTLREEFLEIHLVIVGPFEPQDPVPPEVTRLLHEDPRVHVAGEDWNTPPLYAATDIVVLPTYREGFPVVPIEAAAMGLPVVATRVPGCVDAVQDGVTGLLVPPRDTGALAAAIRTYLESPALRREHGQAGRVRVLRDFRPETMWEATRAEYEHLLLSKGIRIPGQAGGRERRVAVNTGRAKSRARLAAKRLIDLLGAVAGLILLAPVLAVVAASIRITSGSPVFFRQRRPGLHGRPFTLLKFRTMSDARDAGGNLLPDGERLTRVGRFLRSTSLDELPELINVLKGDMSLVGPRPLLMQYLDRYTPEQRRRHEVKPGITGWAQVNGRNALTWEEKFALDVWYVDHQSLWLDMKILALTIWKVLKREGISQPGQATAEEFMGTRS